MNEATARAKPECAARLSLPEAPLQRLVLQAHVPVSPSQFFCNDDMPHPLTVGKSVGKRNRKCCLLSRHKISQAGVGLKTVLRLRESRLPLAAGQPFFSELLHKVYVTKLHVAEFREDTCVMELFNVTQP